MENINEILAKNISVLRRAKGFTQESLAERLGISYQAVSKWETAKSTPDITLLADLADLFDCTIDYLFSRDVEPNSLCDKILWDDDDKIRAVVFCGKRILKASIPSDAGILEKIHFELSGDAKSIECQCNVTVTGSVSGGVQSTGDVVVGGSVSGAINACREVIVGGNLSGGIYSNREITVGRDVIGNVNSDREIAVGGNVKGNIECKREISVNGNVEADKIIGNVTCNSLGRCDKIVGDVTINKASE